jgi:hypothetical protein
MKKCIITSEIIITVSSESGNITVSISRLYNNPIESTVESTQLNPPYTLV